jgi:hypothetical protein
LANGQIYVTHIINGLAKADPAHAAAYQQRGEAYLAQLKDNRSMGARATGGGSPGPAARHYFPRCVSVISARPMGWSFWRRWAGIPKTNHSAKQIATLDPPN